MSEFSDRWAAVEGCDAFAEEFVDDMRDRAGCLRDYPVRQPRGGR